MAKLWRYNSRGECVADDCRLLPQPLIHMLANSPHYFSISDNYLRGFSGFDYTRMFGEFDGPYFPKQNGRFLWVRPEKGEPWLANSPDTPDSKNFSPSFAMGMGYVTFRNANRALGLEVEATVFVPLGEMHEVWLVEIRNSSNRKKIIDFIPTVPIFAGSRAYTEYHRDVVRLYNKSRVTDHVEILPGLEWVEGKTDPSPVCYYMSAETETGRKGTRFYSDRESFLGPRYSWASPEAILKNKPPKFQCLGKEAVGAIEFKKISLGPKESARFVVLNGIAETGAEAEKKIKEYSFARGREALESVKTFWAERTGRVTIRTGNKDFTLLWNTWWCYQLSMRYWFGNTGHPQFDYGSDFAGWRDFWQDMMAATVIDPQGLEKRTLHTLEGIRLDGTNATRFFARTKEFGSDEVNGLWCDHPYWTTQTVLLLIRFLGDPHFILRDGIGYFKDGYRDRGETKDIDWKPGYIERQKAEDGGAYTGTVLEHLLTQLQTMFYDAGRNNLLKQKRADWNDAVDQVKGENVTFTLGLAQDMNELADFLEDFAARTGTTEAGVSEELAGLIENGEGKKTATLTAGERQAKLSAYLGKVNGTVSGRKTKVRLSGIIRDLRAKAEASVETVNRVAFNGHYYTGYFHADGKPVDSIFERGALKKKEPSSGDFEMMLMPQTWSLLSKAADKAGVTEKVLNSVFSLLADKGVGGLRLNYPAYGKFDKSIGRITGFAAGTKENNAIFCHANLFMVWALLRRKRADEAYRIFTGINPLAHNQKTLRTGPWIPEYYISSDNPNWPGRGEYPLLTASAGWTRYIFQNFFFGVRGELDGLRIDPCLPATAEFRECGLHINFRGALYEITFKNPRLTRNAVPAAIRVDGKEIKGSLVTPFKEGRHTIEVLLGPAR
ncbi:MAG: GH36-type glycosyl hydrolase domain-containing protein [Endomicrobiales bacterium]